MVPEAIEVSDIVIDINQADDKGDSIDDIERNGHGWDEKTEEIFKTWIDKSREIKREVLVKLNANRTKYRRLNMISFVSSGASTLLATVGALISGDTAITLSSISAGTAFVTFITTSIIHNKALDSKIQSLSSYLATVTNLIAVLETELDMPMKLRKNADELTLTVSSIYTEILSRKDLS